MANFVFEGDTKDVSSRQLEFISGILKDRGFKNEKVTIETVGKAGDNFVANVKRIVVQKDGKSFKMIAKVAPSNEIHRKMMGTSLAFQNEHFMYTVVLAKFSELEKGADLPKSERLRFAACYGCLMEEPNEIILLEDLCASNFIMFDKFKSLSSESVKLVLRSFAILHSLSYALKYQEPETYKHLCDQLINMWELMDNMEQMKSYMIQLENDVIPTLDNIKYKNLVKGLFSQMISNANKNAKYYKGKYHSVIQQGDSWTNNIMFRLQDEDVVECCMIDYQVSNETSPVADIHYMIFNCTDYETRSKHYHEWIDYYHSQLDKRLFNFGIRVNDFYTRDRLDADLRRHAKVSFGQGVMLASMLTREHHEAANLKETFGKEGNMEELLNVSKLSTMESASKMRFKNRLEGLIKSFIEFGYL